MKPAKTIFFFLGVFIMLAFGMAVVPAKGIHLGFFTFQLPSFQEIFSKETTEYVDVSVIVESQFDIDSFDTQTIDTLPQDIAVAEVIRADYDSLVKSIQRIEFSEAGRVAMDTFFQTLRNDSTARILHYGDSQIEGDRITSYIRNKLQVRFGGSGPGLRPAVQPYDYVFSAKQIHSDNWKRYPVYGRVDSLVEHSNYGVMGAFARYAPLSNDSLLQAEDQFYKASLRIMKSDIAFNRVKTFQNLSFYYGNLHKDAEMQVIVEEDTIHSEKLITGIDFAVVSLNLPDTTDDISLQFSGYDSPDVYGIELGDTTGITVDNIALRGSSGTIFTKLNLDHSLKMYKHLNPRLVILQFGGNVMPYIKDQEAIKRYGRWFSAQIRRVQYNCPDAAMLVIGPSDMSTKEKDKYVSYEYLPDVVVALRNAALETGCSFWDMYSAMGGKNSMPGWVNAEPELARPDYTHFSPRGARLIANMFYNALILEYNEFIRSRYNG